MKSKTATPIPKYIVKIDLLNELYKFASREETRYYLMGVNVEFTKRGVLYTATDGHRLVAAIDRRHTYKKLFSLIVPSEFCKQLKTPRGPSADGVLKIDGKEATITIGASDFGFRPIDGTYPNWRKEGKIAPSKVSGKIAQFNGAYLKDFEDLGNSRALGGPVVCHNGPSDPCPIVFPKSADVIGFLMPMHKEANYTRPEWCAAA